jgi:BlaI family transcriptional regulator, penicillinase repressor
MRSPHPTLTPQELAIMKVVWRLEQATVRDVYRALQDQRPVAYTTVMTMMRILEGKGYLRKRLKDRAYIYRPARARQLVVGAMVRDFLDRVFDGASRPLLLHLTEDERLSDKERQALRRLIDEIDEGSAERED